MAGNLEHGIIGIVGYGMVGKAVENGFCYATAIVSDPQYNAISIKDICSANPKAIFVCVPTPTDHTEYSLLRGVLQEIKETGYTGLTVVKSTVLPQYIEEFDVLYNPEFLSRATSFEDFVNPPMLLIGGNRAEELLDIYRRLSRVDTQNAVLTNIQTASLAKYTMNSFYALKVTYMNSMYDVAYKMGVDWEDLTAILAKQPWMGTHHFQVPGPDGQRGFGGPCLPKDTKALVYEYDIAILKKVLELNDEFRDDNDK